MGRAFDHAEYCFPRGYLAGLTISQTASGTTTFTVAAGEAVDSTQATIITLTSAMSKTTSAWASGTGNGGLDTGAIAANTFYHVYVIKNVTTQAVDVLFSLSATAPTMPSGYTLFRRIGSVGADGTSKWLFVRQNGDEFLFDTPINSVNALATSNTTTLTTVAVPSGIKVNALVRCLLGFITAAVQALVTAGDLTTANTNTPTGNYNMFSGGSTVVGSFDGSVRTNTAGQVITSFSGTGCNFYLVTVGWIDTRGRFS